MSVVFLNNYRVVHDEVLFPSSSISTTHRRNTTIKENGAIKQKK